MGETASGLAAMAYFPKQRLAKLALPTTDWTGHVIFDGIASNSIVHRLERVRQDGYATSLSAMTRGVNAVAAPIWWRDEVPYGSLVLTADEKNMPEGELASFGNKVRDMAEEATNALGGAELRRQAEQTIAGQNHYLIFCII